MWVWIRINKDYMNIILTCQHDISTGKTNHYFHATLTGIKILFKQLVMFIWMCKSVIYILHVMNPAKCVTRWYLCEKKFVSSKCGLNLISISISQNLNSKLIKRGKINDRKFKPRLYNEACHFLVKSGSIFMMTDITSKPVFF